MSIRPVKRLIKAKPTLEGAGVHLRRAFGFGETGDFDPFLLLDDFRNERPEDYLAGFPWHPHRGIETITYVLAGTVEHGDSLGNHGELASGDVQWMTAGSGIIHQEMPRGDADGRMHGFQLWANLPSSLKMTAPRYQDVQSADIPEVTEDDGTRARVICGDFWGATGPVDGIAAEPRYLDVSVPPRTRTNAGRRHRTATPSPTSSPAPASSATPPSRSTCPPRASAGRTPTPPREADNRSLVRLRQRRRGHRRRRRGGDPLPPRLRAADRGAGRLVRPHRDEHAGGAAPGLRGVRGRDVSEAALTHLPSPGSRLRHCAICHRTSLVSATSIRPK